MKNPNELPVALDTGGRTTALAYAAADPALGATLILGHGAGAGQRSPFMVATARALAARGVHVVTFNFLYTEQKRRIPDRAPVLEACFRAVIDVVSRTGFRDARGNLSPTAAAGGSLFIGGKSMGGRISTQLAAADPRLPIAGLVLLGYPLHPPGRRDERRDRHLPSVGRPMLFVQGSRDAFGTPAELEPILAAIGSAAMLHVVPGGDHSLRLARRDPAAQAAADDDVHRSVVEWIAGLTRTAGRETRRPL